MTTSQYGHRRKSGVQGPKRQHLRYNWDGHQMGTPDEEGLRGQWVINSLCQGLATVTSE